MTEEPIIEMWDTFAYDHFETELYDIPGGETRITPGLRAAIMENFSGKRNDPIVTLCGYEKYPNEATFYIRNSDFATHVVLNKNPTFEYEGVSRRDIALQLGVLPLTIMGVGITEDGYVLLGERKPKTGVSRGSFTTVPGGYCHPEDDSCGRALVVGTFQRELVEELPAGICSKEPIPLGLAYSNDINRGFSVPFLFDIGYTSEIARKHLEKYESAEMGNHYLVPFQESRDKLIEFLGEHTEFKPEMLSNHGLAALLFASWSQHGKKHYQTFLEAIRASSYGNVAEMVPGWYHHYDNISEAVVESRGEI